MNEYLQEVLAGLLSKRDDLDSRRSQLEAAITAVQQILRGNGGEATETNNAMAVLDFLEKEPTRVYTPKVISQHTGLPEKVVRGVVVRLWKRQKIERLVRGKYRSGKSHERAEAAA